MAILGTATSKLLLVDLSSGTTYQTMDTSSIIGVWEAGISFPPPPPPQQGQGLSTTTSPPNNNLNNNMMWMLSYSSPTSVLLINSAAPQNNNAAPSTDWIPIAVGSGIGFLMILNVIFVILYISKK